MREAVRRTARRLFSLLHVRLQAADHHQETVRPIRQLVCRRGSAKRAKIVVETQHNFDTGENRARSATASKNVVAAVSPPCQRGGGTTTREIPGMNAPQLLGGQVALGTTEAKACALTPGNHRWTTAASPLREGAALKVLTMGAELIASWCP